MQVIFVQTVINEIIDVLQNSYTLNNALAEKQANYQEYNHLLDAIANAMLEQTKKVITEGLVKQNRISFSRLDDDLTKLIKNLKRHE